MSDEPNFFEWQAQNPLLQGLMSPPDFVSMGVALHHDPRTAYGGVAIPEDQRMIEAFKIKNLCSPTKLMVQTAMRIYLMWWNALIARDPRMPARKAALYASAEIVGKALKDLPWNLSGATAAILESMSGMGKSLLIERLCSLIPQVIVRGKNTEAGWLQLKQLNWLRVSMPTTATRGAFVLDIALAMDKALGTDYASIVAKERSVERALVRIVHYLDLHFCGMLIIEEGQKRNLTEVIGSEFLLFFLKVMNAGIPVLASGNPKAMTIFETFVQDGRRFSDGIWCTLYPALSWRSEEWSVDLVPRVWAFSVMPEPDEPIPDLAQFLWERTGGWPEALARLRRESMCLALFEGSPNVCLEHVQAAFEGPEIAPLRSVIDALVKRNAVELKAHTDIPVEWFIVQWEQLRQAEQEARRTTTTGTSSPTEDGVRQTANA